MSSLPLPHWHHVHFYGFWSTHFGYSSSWWNYVSDAILPYFFFFVFQLLYWRYTVTFTKVLTIYQSWIHPLFCPIFLSTVLAVFLLPWWFPFFALWSWKSGWGLKHSPCSHWPNLHGLFKCCQLW
jgi:hypothetical protein